MQQLTNRRRVDHARCNNLKLSSTSVFINSSPLFHVSLCLLHARNDKQQTLTMNFIKCTSRALLLETFSSEFYHHIYLDKIFLRASRSAAASLAPCALSPSRGICAGCMLQSTALHPLNIYLLSWMDWMPWRARGVRV